MYNLMVYLIQEFHIKSIDAALIFNLVNGCTSLIPVVAAIVADSFLGCYAVVWISSVISVLVIYYTMYVTLATILSDTSKVCRSMKSN